MPEEIFVLSSNKVTWSQFGLISGGPRQNSLKWLQYSFSISFREYPRETESCMMSTELFPSSQGNGRTVLILTGSNKRDHLLGYFIISLFICMWALQEAPNCPLMLMAGGKPRWMCSFGAGSRHLVGSVQGQELDSDGPCGSLSILFL